jgi:hypothetical protein
VIRAIFDDYARIVHAIEAMLHELEIVLLNGDGTEVPKWQWRNALATVTRQSVQCGSRLSITKKGIRRIAYVIVSQMMDHGDRQQFHITAVPTGRLRS